MFHEEDGRMQVQVSVFYYSQYGRQIKGLGNTQEHKTKE